MSTIDPSGGHLKTLGGSPAEWDTMRRALDTWGFESQALKALEECSEFSAALLKYGHDRVTVEEVASEIADVIIMARQIALHFGIDLVASEIDRKMERVRARIEDHHSGSQPSGDGASAEVGDWGPLFRQY